MIAIKSTRRIPLAKLKRYPGNAKVHDLESIKDSIRANGQFQTLVVHAATLEVLAGNGTYEAMRQLQTAGEFGKVAVCHLVDVDRAGARRIVLADNRTAERGGWDESALAQLLADAARDGGLEGTGYAPADLDALLAPIETGDAPVEEDVVPKFGVVVDVPDEAAQREVIEILAGRGLEPRAIFV